MELRFDNLDLPSVLSSIIPLTVAFFLSNKTLNLQLKVLLFYLLVSFFTDIVSYFHILKVNYYLLNAFTLVEFLVILFVFYIQWNTPKAKIRIISIAVIFLAYFVLASLLIVNLNDLYVYINTFKALTITLISLMYFFKLTNNTEISSLTQFYFFWFNTAFLIYFSVVLFVFLFMNYILDPGASQPVKNLWLLHNFVHIIYNTLLGIGLIKWKRANQ